MTRGWPLSLSIVLVACGGATAPADAGRDAGLDAAVPADASTHDASRPLDAAADAASDARVTDADLDAQLGDGATLDASDGGARDASACATELLDIAPVASPHVALCSEITYDSNPPTSGPHYPAWAAYTTYTAPVPWGYLVHDLEHGGVVIAYDCPSGCDADLAALAAFLDARPADPICTPPLRARVVVVPDPGLGVRFAAAAWGHALRSQCFDLDALAAFFDAHYAQAPENECADGVADPSCP